PPGERWRGRRGGRTNRVAGHDSQRRRGARSRRAASGGGGTARRDYAATWPVGLVPSQPSRRGACLRMDVAPLLEEDPMLPRAWLPVPILLVLALPARAQSAADARWVSECRERGDDWRAEHCEVRVVPLVPGGTEPVDPGQNGGFGGS